MSTFLDSFCQTRLNSTIDVTLKLFTKATKMASNNLIWWHTGLVCWQKIAFNLEVSGSKRFNVFCFFHFFIVRHL